MRHLFTVILSAACTVAPLIAVASNYVETVAVGQVITTDEGVDRVIASRGWKPNLYYVSSFAHGPKCNSASRCTDGANIVGPAGKVHIAHADMTTAQAAISVGEHPVAVVLVPHSGGGFVANVFRFVNDRPVPAMTSRPILITQDAGPDCSARGLCANAVAINFDEGGGQLWPDIILRQTASRRTKNGDDFKPFQKVNAYTYDPLRKRYVARRWTN